MDISEKVKEAETYRSMGLLEESILIYEEILSFEFALEDTIRDHFKSMIAEIRAEMESLEDGAANTVTDEEIAIIKNTLSLEDEIPYILESASAFMEMDQYQHALAEYKKLFVKEKAWKDASPIIVECILKCGDLPEISPLIKEMVAETGGKDQYRAEILFHFGLEMQRRNLQVVAHELCAFALEIDPGNKDIIKWLDSNDVQQNHSAKQDHSEIHNKAITRHVEHEGSNGIIEITIEFTEDAQIVSKADDDFSEVAVTFVDQAIISAFRSKVSDIQFESHPEAKCIKILFRSNGNRYRFAELPISMAQALISRIKYLAHLDSAEKPYPQKGSIRFRRDGIPDRELTIETHPAIGGYEDAVLRMQV